MQVEINNYKDIIDLYPNVTALAEACGVPLNTAVQWRCRNRIPAEHWRAIINSLPDHGVDGVDADLFVDLAAGV